MKSFTLRYLLITILISMFGIGEAAAALEAYAHYNSGTLTFYYDNQRSGRSGKTYDLNGYALEYWYVNELRRRKERVWEASSDKPAWVNDGTNVNVTHVVFDASFYYTRPETTGYWFYNMNNLKTITGMKENLNTSEVKCMDYMFSGCSLLKAIDVTSFQTGKVKTFKCMFNGCSSLEYLNVSGFDFHFLEENIEECLYPGGETRYGDGVFLCYGDGIDGMFNGCSSLKTIYDRDREYWDFLNSTENGFLLPSGKLMFSGCTSLVGGAGTVYAPAYTNYNFAHVDRGPANPGYLTNVAYAEYDLNGTLTFYSDGKRHERQGKVFSISNDGMPEWFEQDFLPDITKVVFDSSFKNVRPTTMSFWFYNFKNLQSITDMDEYLNTSEVKDMSFAFGSCNSLTSLDLSHFDTRNVTNMSAMFSCCEALESIDLSSFDTQNVTDMSVMFSSCFVLESIDLSNFYTPNVTDMNSMFWGCEKLKTIDLGSFAFGMVNDYSDMFNGCKSLERIYVWSDNWQIANDANTNNMFFGCNALVGGMGTTYDINHVDGAYARTDEGQANPGYFSAIPYALIKETSDGVYQMRFYCDSYANRRVSRGEGDAYSALNTPWWQYTYAKDKIEDIFFDPSFQYARPTSMARWFKDMVKVNNLFEMGWYLNTSEVTDMSEMFSGCNQILMNHINLSCFDTRNVTDMHGMFEGCEQLDNPYLSSFDTHNVTDMSEMFRGCRNLKDLDLSNFDTRNVTDMHGMFAGCDNKLMYLQLSNFNTSNVTDMSEMFSGCSKLAFVDLSSFDTRNVKDMNHMFSHAMVPFPDLSRFDTRNVTDMSSMFEGSQVNKELDLSNFDTRNVTNMSAMFMDCIYLYDINMANFDTRNVTNMSYMFNNCGGLWRLDLSSFDTRNVTDMHRMFQFDGKLQTIFVSDSWTTERLNSSYEMFQSCNSILGEQGTTYDMNHTDGSYAHIDGGTENPGYLCWKEKPTLKGDVNGDGAVDVADIATIIDVMAGSSLQYKDKADVNGDNTVDVADIASVIDIMAGM